MKVSVDGSRCFILTCRQAEQTAKLKERDKGGLKAARQVHITDLQTEDESAGGCSYYYYKSALTEY